MVVYRWCLNSRHQPDYHKLFWKMLAITFRRLCKGCATYFKPKISEHNTANLCTFPFFLRTVILWCISDRYGSSAGWEISNPSDLTISMYLQEIILTNQAQQ